MSDLTRRTFLVQIGNAVLGTFVLPLPGSGIAEGDTCESGKSVRRLLAPPDKIYLASDNGPFTLMWAEAGRGLLVWSPDSPEEIAEAQRFYDAARDVGSTTSEPVNPPSRNRIEIRFLEAIRSDLESDTARITYGRWLMGRNDPLGEFIELDCLLERMTSDDPKREQFEDRRSELLDEHADLWFAPLRSIGLTLDVFGVFLPLMWYRRGFVEELNIDKPSILPDHAETLFGTAPILHRLVIKHDKLDIKGIVGVPQMAQVTALDLSDAVLDEQAVSALLTAQTLERLQELKVERIRIDEGIAQKIARSPVIGRLNSLSMRSCALTPAALEILTQAPSLCHLEKLTLMHCHLGEEAKAALRASPHLGRLKELHVS